MSNYERVKRLLAKYFADKGVTVDLEKDLHVVSLNEQGSKYLFDGEKNLKVISMDDVAKDGYRQTKEAVGNPVNTVDAFLADVNNEWFFMELERPEVRRTLGLIILPQNLPLIQHSTL